MSPTFCAIHALFTNSLLGSCRSCTVSADRNTPLTCQALTEPFSQLHPQHRSHLWRMSSRDHRIKSIQLLTNHRSPSFYTLVRVVSRKQ